MKTLLITGADGFTGQHLIPAATRAGWQCVPLKADLTNASAVANEVFELNPSAVIHLAAISFVAHDDPAQIYAVNVFGTLNLLEALSQLACKPSIVCLPSSSTIYGNSPLPQISEAVPPAPNSHYGASKLVMEHLARNFSDRLPLTILRPFNYTGPGHSNQFVIPKLVDHFSRRTSSIELGNVDVEREFNDVRMVVAAYVRLLDCPSSEVGAVGLFNVCSGRPIALSSVISSLERLTGHRMAVNVNPAFVRAHEIRSSCGDPSRLVARVGALPSYALEETLLWMLDASEAGRA